MKIVHTYVKFQDQFSFAYSAKIVTVSEEKHNKMVEGIGTTFSHFDKVNHIREDLKVITVRRATESDYKETNTPVFYNEPE
jgi:hypothetical protein